jgi:hypothetical protein
MKEFGNPAQAFKKMVTRSEENFEVQKDPSRQKKFIKKFGNWF